MPIWRRATAAAGATAAARQRPGRERVRRLAFFQTSYLGRFPLVFDHFWTAIRSGQAVTTLGLAETTHVEETLNHPRPAPAPAVAGRELRPRAPVAEEDVLGVAEVAALFLGAAPVDEGALASASLSAEELGADSDAHDCPGRPAPRGRGRRRARTQVSPSARGGDPRPRRRGSAAAGMWLSAAAARQQRRDLGGGRGVVGRPGGRVREGGLGGERGSRRGRGDEGRAPAADLGEGVLERLAGVRGLVLEAGEVQTQWVRGGVMRQQSLRWGPQRPRGRGARRPCVAT